MLLQLQQVRSMSYKYAPSGVTTLATIPSNQMYATTLHRQKVAPKRQEQDQKDMCLELDPNYYIL